MKRFSFLRPISFKADGTFAWHDLAKNWLKRLSYEQKGNGYALKGAAPSGGDYTAYFDSAGHFQMMKISSWSRAAISGRNVCEIHITQMTQYIDRIGAVWTSMRCFEVTNSLVMSENVSTRVVNRVITELKRQGVKLPEDCQVVLTEKIRSSYLAPGRHASVHSKWCNEQWIRHDNPAKGMYPEMPINHMKHWMD